MRTQVAVIITAVALSLVAACDKTSTPEPTSRTDKDATRARTPSKLGDLSTSLAAVREAFNAKKGQARFLTLLSPT